MSKEINLISSSLSFLNYPSISPMSLKDYDIGIIGVPSELGTTEMPGCRYGPREIRIASQQYTGHLSEQKKDLSDAWIGDLGDLEVIQGRPIYFVETAQKVFGQLAEYKKTLAFLGGDHLMTFCSVSGLRKELIHPPAILWIDAHLDFDDEYPSGVKYSHATVLKRLSDLKCIDSGNSVVLGYRGYASRAIAEKRASEAGINIFSMQNMRKQSFSSVLEQTIKFLSEAPAIYVSVDIDALDCAYAPGTGVHEPGGFAPWELLEVIRSLNTLKTKIIGVDVVEVNPLRDPTGSTCSIAAIILLELLGVALNTYSHKKKE
ncbi:MAG: arginase family protein [Candidatus Hermodarchaeota archaeon]